MHLPGRFLAGFGQSIQKKRAVPVAQENRLAAVATIDDVIDRSGIFNAESSGHEQELTPDEAVSQ